MTRLRFAVVALMFCGSVHAGPLRFSAGVWDYEITGHDVDNGVRRDFERDLAVQPAGQLRLALEYDVAADYWPDLAATYSEFGGAGRAPVQGALLRPGTSVETRGDFTDADLTARWPLRIGAFQLSPGLSLKRLEGEFVIDDPASASVTRQAVDEVFPQVHGELYWEYGPFDISAAVQAISADDQAANEFRVLAGLQVFGPLYLQAGWQQKRYDLRQPGFEIHARLSGALFQAELTF